MTTLKKNPRADVRWELDIDGKHTVTVADKIVVHTAVESLARIMYE